MAANVESWNNQVQSLDDVSKYRRKACTLLSLLKINKNLGSLAYPLPFPFLSHYPVTHSNTSVNRTFSQLTRQFSKWLKVRTSFALRADHPITRCITTLGTYHEVLFAEGISTVCASEEFRGGEYAAGMLTFSFVGSVVPRH